MNQPVLYVLDVVLSAACSQAAILVEVSLQISVDSLSDRVASDIKLPLFV